MPGVSANPNETIICRVTPWYYRRMGMLAAMFLGMGLYFFYDGRFGYPKANEAAMNKEWFEREIVGSTKKTDREIESYEEAQKMGEEHLGAWVKMAREKGWIVSPSLTEPRWADYAAAHNWPENPKYHSDGDIRQQFYWGGAMVLGAAIAGALLLRNHKKVLVGHPEHMVMPDGTPVRYADVTRVDKRKWDHKGLASIFYRESPETSTRRVFIDDFMYGGAGKVLNRLLSQFKGELIEKVPDRSEATADTPPAAASEAPPKAQG